ncbi:lipid II flippase MurJ [Methylophilus glucosoxydans]|uniref:Lipid II flippase MurJ n=1 Tax=Methylophilus glucosoxydans TaxID=752553 RepID=A0ABW3GIJ2_9PROT
MRKAVYQLFVGNLSSKLVGFIREILTAAIFGTGSVIAAYRISLTGVLSPINFLTSDTLNTAFVPTYKSLFETDKEQAQTLLYTLISLFVVFSLLLSIVLFLFAKTWVGMMAPELDSNTLKLTLDMFSVILIAIPFYLLSAIFLFLCMARGDFVPMAVRPLIQNLGMILGTLLTFWSKNLSYLAWGFTISYVFFLFWVFFRALNQEFLTLPNFFAPTKIKDVLKAFWQTLKPLVVLPFILQGNIVIERMVASLVSIAAISAVDYAKFVTETMILMISTPLAFAGLTHWSGIGLNNMTQKLKGLIGLLTFISVPISAFLIVESYSVVELLYSRGAFNRESTLATGDILYGIAWGLWAQTIAYVLIKALSAQMMNKTVMKITIAALLGNIIFNLITYKYLGAKALGWGNTIYGLILLISTLAVFGLLKDFIKNSWLLISGAFVYIFFLQNILDTSQQTALLTVLAAGIEAIIFWVTWILILKPLRIEAVTYFNLLRKH